MDQEYISGLREGLGEGRLNIHKGAVKEEEVILVICFFLNPSWSDLIEAMKTTYP